MVNTKTVSFIGGPNSGKSTLAAQVNTQLKIKGINAVFIEEYVVDYIANVGIPKTMEHQMVIFEEQRRRETNFYNKRDVILCDSASFTSLIYGRQLMGSILSKHDTETAVSMYRKAIGTLDYWDYIFYLPVIGSSSNTDEIRHHNKHESEKIGSMLKGFLDIECVDYIDLSGQGFEERLNFVVQKILGKEK